MMLFAVFASSRDLCLYRRHLKSKACTRKGLLRGFFQRAASLCLGAHALLATTVHFVQRVGGGFVNGFTIFPDYDGYPCPLMLHERVANALGDGLIDRAAIDHQMLKIRHFAALGDRLQ